MNVLLLTPDRVGSTLLQRVLTIYMLRKGFDKPVINLHELTNGLEKYIHEDLQIEVLGKFNDRNKWGYFQSLPEIIELLKSTNHYKTSRLAQYHIKKRNDSISDQLEFYEYLNKNFYIISCRRENLLEHALSWAIYTHSKHLNLYETHTKKQHFDKIYKNKIKVEREHIHKYLTAYKEYINWCNTYFDVQTYFNYEDSIENLEDFILNLDFMKGSKDNTWHNMFGMDFKNWNKCHKTVADLNLIKDTKNLVKVQSPSPLMSQLDWDRMKGEDWPELLPFDLNNESVNNKIKQEIQVKSEANEIEINVDKADYLRKTYQHYKRISDIQEELVRDGYLVSKVPIKLQTFKEKKEIISNISDCIKWYNEWVQENNFGKTFDEDSFNDISELEELKFNNFNEQLPYQSAPNRNLD